MVQTRKMPLAPAHRQIHPISVSPPLQAFSTFKEKLDLIQKSTHQESCRFHSEQCACSGSVKLKAVERAFAQLHITCSSSALQQGRSSVTNSLHGLTLQTCTPASKAYSWKHYACIPKSGWLGRNLGCPGDTAGTWHCPRVSLAPSGGLQQHSKPPSPAKKSHMLRRTPSGRNQDSLGCFLTTHDTKISSRIKVPPNSFQQAPDTCPGVLLACLSIPVIPEFALWLLSFS